MKKDIQLCIDFDSSCEHFWLYHYKTSYIDHRGMCKWKYIKNDIDTYNIFLNDN